MKTEYGLEARDPKAHSGFTPNIMQIHRENLMVWRLRIPKTILDSLPKSCKYRENQVVWGIRIRTVIFPKLHVYRELEAFEDSCLIRGSSIWTLTGLDRYSSAIFAILTFVDRS